MSGATSAYANAGRGSRQRAWRRRRRRRGVMGAGLCMDGSVGDAEACSVNVLLARGDLHQRLQVYLLVGTPRLHAAVVAYYNL